jgi:ADP-ribose pyrophosphatase YjhB (NUDIX family)
MARVVAADTWLGLRRRAWSFVSRAAPVWVKQAYPTPKVDVRGVVFRDGRILLVREVADGRWTLPGGWADVGESAAEAVVREVQEESGYATRADRLIGVYNLDRLRDGRPLRPNVYKLFIRCELERERASPIVGAETNEAAFFAEDDLPELSVPRVSRDQLERVFAHERDPRLPPDVD